MAGKVPFFLPAPTSAAELGGYFFEQTTAKHLSETHKEIKNHELKSDSPKAKPQSSQPLQGY
jgi:hypothetical protein